VNAMNDDRLPDVLRLCQDALAREGGERAVYLEAACGGDSDLRREVEALLSEQEAGGPSLLDTPAWPPPVPMLTLGQRLGPYEVIGRIGAGGMGAVYQACDTRLGRTVALKVIAEAGALDPLARERFTREARTVASLSHPHICALHDVGREGEVDFLVMEYLEGETLAGRLAKGPLPLRQALTVATEIADALATAHRQGVIHRDLKPGNVMLTRTGAKLLDFGLAKLRAPGAAAAGAGSPSALRSGEPVTTPGAILGTVPYMAPEQLEGKEADARTDLFAFGCVVYEMLAGQRAFSGDSQASLIAAIMSSPPPPLSSIRPVTPPALDRLVDKCLAKDPEARWQNAADLADALRWMPESANGRVAVTARRRGRRALRVALLLAATCLLVLAGWWGVPRTGRPSPPPIYATVPLTTEQVDHTGQFAHFAISPDGQLLVFREGAALVSRRLGSFATTPIDGVRDALHVAFKPDGTAVTFASTGKIWQVPVSGAGSATEVAVASVGPGMSWGEDDRIYYSAGVSGGIWRVPAAGGGKPEAVTHLREEAGEGAHAWPQLLPGGKALLFTTIGPSGGSGDARIVVEILASHQRTTVAQQAMGGRYLASGHLLFARNDGTVYAAPFDLARLVTTGTPDAVLSPVRIGTWGGGIFLAASSTGTVAFLRPSQRPECSFRVVDALGRAARSPFAFDSLSTPQIGTSCGSVQVAPGAERCALTGRRAGANDVWILDGTQVDRFTFGPEEEEVGVWSPDGRAIAYTAGRRIMIKRVASGSEPTLVKTWPRHVHVTSWSPDGRWLGLDESDPTGGWNAWTVATDGSSAVVVARSAATEHCGPFSPDGKWLAYYSDESGRREVYVVPFPGPGSARQVSTDGGERPAWDERGRVLYYLQNGYLVAHEVRLGDDFGKGRATRLFATQPKDFDVLPANRFVLTEPNTAPPDSPLHLIFNWFEELKAKVPPR